MTNERPVATRKVFREDIFNVLREAIFSNELQPGERIIETYWSNKLGVSQGPVREAIRDLDALGLVETIPFKGTRVRKLSKKDVQDNYSVRMCLETKSIKDAIQCLNTQEHKTLFQELHKVLLEMDQAAETVDLRRFINSDTQFHQTIIEATGNQVLFRLWEQCNIRNWNIIPENSRRESLRVLQEEHAKLLMAINDRNLTQATSIIEGHLVGLMENFIASME